MQEFFDHAITGLIQKSGLELVAVGFALAYLILAMRENIWCWLCALMSTALYTWIFFDVSLIMESLLNTYYMAMAVYGYWSWTSRGQSGMPNTASNSVISITTWKISSHLVAFAIIGTLTIISGYLLSKNTDAAWPYLDSFTTWGAVVTTYMVARKILENWLYWLVINSLALFLYIDRGLHPTALLMMLYLVLSVIGFISWFRTYRQQASTIANVAASTES